MTFQAAVYQPNFRVATIERRRRFCVIEEGETVTLNETITRIEITLPSLVVGLKDETRRQVCRFGRWLTEKVDQVRLTISVVGSVVGGLTAEAVSAVG